MKRSFSLTITDISNGWCIKNTLVFFFVVSAAMRLWIAHSQHDTQGVPSSAYEGAGSVSDKPVSHKRPREVCVYGFVELGTG